MSETLGCQSFGICVCRAGPRFLPLALGLISKSSAVCFGCSGCVSALCAPTTTLVVGLLSGLLSGNGLPFWANGFALLGNCTCPFGQLAVFTTASGTKEYHFVWSLPCLLKQPERTKPASSSLSNAVRICLGDRYGNRSLKAETELYVQCRPSCSCIPFAAFFSHQCCML